MYVTCRFSKSCSSHKRNVPCKTRAFTRFRSFVPYGRDIANFWKVRSPYKRDTEWHNERFHGSTSIVLQKAPQLTTPSVFASNDQPPTSHSLTAMLQLRCHRHPCRSYCCQQAQRPTFCALLALLWTSSLALPQEPCPSCSILVFERLLSQTTVVRFFLRETSVQTFFGRPPSQHGLTFGRPLSQPSHFL